MVPSYVFYDKQEALDWARTTSYPKVFKLKGGAGAANVKLVKTEKKAKQLINKAFGRGFPQFDRFTGLNERLRKYREKQGGIIDVAKGIGRVFISHDFSKQQSRERGYIYFQDFIPNNKYDTRVVVIDVKYAAAEKRFVRKNDFRASGSGDFSYENINSEVIKIGVEVANKLNLQSIAFDFVLDKNQKPLIVEISYGFGTSGISNVSGYWDSQLNWHEGSFKPEEWMLTHLLKSIKNNDFLP